MHRHSLGRVWGVTQAEQALPFPCDELLRPADDVLYRGVTVRAPVPVVFRWLCQLRAAPYSYDWIDNIGRQSPRHLISGLEQLAIGQTVMTIFTLVSFDLDRQITLCTNRAGQRAFGDVVGTYAVFAQAEETRLLVKLRVRYPSGLFGAFLQRVLPVGDAIMMRRQLLTLKALAEATARIGTPNA